MNKTTKGALAATAASVLLLGGAGTLAFWTDDAVVNGGAINSGRLEINPLGTPSCDANWVYAPGAAKAGQTVSLFVPGDKVTKKCTFTILASGDNLTATVDAPASLNVVGSRGGSPVTSSLSVTTGATYALTNVTTPRSIVNGGTISSADNGGTMTATFLATIPYGTNEAGTPKVNANDTQTILATLDALTVKVTQVNPNP